MLTTLGFDGTGDSLCADAGLVTPDFEKSREWSFAPVVDRTGFALDSIGYMHRHGGVIVDMEEFERERQENRLREAEIYDRIAADLETRDDPWDQKKAGELRDRADRLHSGVEDA